MRVPLERANMFPRRHVKNFNELVGRSGEEKRSVARELDPHYGVAVCVLNIADQFHLGHVPNLEFPAARRFAAAGGQELAVAAKIERQHPADEWRCRYVQRFFSRRAEPGCQCPLGHGVPDGNFAVGGSGNQRVGRRKRNLRDARPGGSDDVQRRARARGVELNCTVFAGRCQNATVG